MAPILKEADSPIAAATSTASPIAKSPTETPTRPQPVAVEIPVTINGARTVDGSDKREPFSESSLTVLVFSHGAVVRVSTPLAPGQLIFLTNEKSKKEVVCQVIKSKSGGSTGAYVELQFTEPAPGFWGLRMPGATAAPVAVPPASSSPAPAAPKLVSPIAPVAPKPVTPAPSSPVLSASTILPPSKPMLAPAPVPAATIEPVVAPPVVAEPPAAPVSVAPPPPVPTFTEPAPPPVPTLLPESVVPPAPAIPSVPPPSPQQPLALIPPAPLVAPKPPVILAPLGDYSKEIEALFATPPAPTNEPAPKKVEEAKPVPDSATPSSEELKLQTARLQAQLSSLLFTDAPAASPAASTPPAPSAADSPFAEVAKKVVEIAHKEPAPAPKLDFKTAPPAPKSVAPLLPLDDEVKIPAWLAPLSQNADTSVAPVPSSEESTSVSVSESSNDSGDSLDTTVDSSPRAETAVFGGQLLGESAAPQDQVAAGGSRKGIFIGLAAAAALLAAAGYWYSRQNTSATPRVAAAQSVNAPSSDPLVQTSSLPSAKGSSSPSPTLTNPSLKTSSPFTPQPAKSSERVSSAPPAVSPEPKNSDSASRNATPADSAKKPALGQVRLAAPVVNRGAQPDNNAALPSIDTNVPTSGADAFVAEAASHRKEPAAPVPIGGDVKPAELVKSVPPVYPAMAKTQRISGNVQLDALVDESGNVSAVKVISGPPLLHRAALDAVKQWKYTPATLDGKPTTMHLTVTVQFRTQ